MNIDFSLRLRMIVCRCFAADTHSGAKKPFFSFSFYLWSRQASSSFQRSFESYKNDSNRSFSNQHNGRKKRFGKHLTALMDPFLSPPLAELNLQSTHTGLDMQYLHVVLNGHVIRIETNRTRNYFRI